MKLFTKGIEKKLQDQYSKGSTMSGQDVIVKIFNPVGGWTWYIMNQDPDDPDYLWGIVKGFETEMGSISKKDLESQVGALNMKLERDISFKPMNAEELWDKLMDGKHV